MTDEYRLDGVALDEKSVVVDVGALSGRFALYVWRTFGSKETHTIEPARKAFLTL